MCTSTKTSQDLHFWHTCMSWKHQNTHKSYYIMCWMKIIYNGLTRPHSKWLTINIVSSIFVKIFDFPNTNSAHRWDVYSTGFKHQLIWGKLMAPMSARDGVPHRFRLWQQARLFQANRTCQPDVKYIWSNYSDLTRPGGLVMEFPFFSGKSELVRYYNLARCLLGVEMSNEILHFDCIISLYQVYGIRYM